MNRLFTVADGILDDSYDYTAETINDIERIIGYAEAIDIDLSYEEAEMIKKVGLVWLKRREEEDTHGDHNYYYTVQEPLEDFECKK